MLGFNDPTEPFSKDGSDKEIYQKWIIERQHILRNKWYLSQQMGADCGWEHARWDWDMRHRQKWLREWEERNRDSSNPPQSQS